MTRLFIDNPLVLLFVVAALGYLIGNFKVRGSSLGVSAVLFVGLFFGAVNGEFYIPDIILQLGLAIFVYMIGLSSGPAFFTMYRKHGLKDFGFIIGMLCLSGLVTVGLWFLFDFSAAKAAGIYTGSTTNTAALAGVLDYMSSNYDPQTAGEFADQAVIGYSFSYPMGVLGGMIAIVWAQKWLKIDYAQEAKKWRKEYALDDRLTSRAIEISNEKVCGVELRELMRKYDWNINFGRILKGEKLYLINWSTTFQKGDVIIVVGNEEDLENVISTFGKRVKMPHTADSRSYDARSIFVSNPQVAGNTIASLNLDERFDAIITRIRRGDVEMLAKGETVLELGDRIRFMARRKDLKKLSALFGDSYHQSSKINLFSLGIGLGLGLILGSLTIDLGSSFSFKLGYAGGPLIIGLLLGGIRRTGKILWTLPYGANVTMQQLGLMLLLAVLGVRSGSALMQSLSLDSLWIVLGSAVISLVTALSILLIGYKVMKRPFGLLMGMVANQPAILDFALDKAKNRLPMYGFTLIFPIALILKILIAQLLFLVLR